VVPVNLVPLTVAELQALSPERQQMALDLSAEAMMDWRLVFVASCANRWTTAPVR
jgi:hypothetical protein